MATAAAAAAEIQETLSSTETAILMERIVSDFTMEEFNKSNGAGDLDCLQKPIEHLEEQREGESFFQSPSLAAEKTGSAVIQEEKTMVRQEDSLQTKETEDKSVDDIVISEDGEQEQCHPSIQHLEESETVEDKETTCIDDLEAESTEAVGLPESMSMEQGNEVTQIGDEGKEPAAALDTDGYVSGGEHGEDIQKEELSSVEVNSSVEIAEPTVPSDALDTVSIPPLPLELVESSSSMVVSEIETREGLEEALESNSYLNEAKESPTIGDATDETMLDGSEACEVLESGVKEKECLEEASIIQVDENEEVHSGNQEKEIETMEVVSSEIEAPEIHMKSEDTEGKDTIVEPEKESATIASEKDYICDEIPNEEVNDEQGSVDTSGEVKEEVLEEVVHVKEIHEERASIPETEDLTTIVEKKDATVESEGTEKLELSSAAGLKEVRLEKEELQKPNDFEVEEKKPEHEDEALASHVQECNTYETEFILNENAAQELSLTLIQDEEHAESRAVEKVHEDTESTKKPREIAIADDPSIEEGHASVQDAEQLSVEVKGSALEKDSIVEENTEEENKNKSKLSAVNEEVLQPKETEDKSIDAIVIMEDEEKEQGHPLIQQDEGLTVSVEDAKPEESKDDEEIETVEDKETICKDVLEAEESTEVVLAEYASMEKENDVNQIGDGDMEPTAALDVSGGDQGGFLEDIQKEELSSSAELQKSNGYQVEETSTAYTEQTEVNSSVEIAETSVPSDAAEVSTPLVPLQFVESSSSVVVSESETREAVEEELESNSYLNEVKETPTIGDATDETMLDGSEACEVPESGVKAKEYLDEASYIQVEVKGKAQDGNEEAKSSETTEVVSSEIELPEIHIKSEDAEGKDKTVEPEEQPATIDAAKDYIRDDISNEEVSVDTSGEVKEQVTEESASIPETEDLTTIVEKKDATVESEETENLELSSAVVLKEVCLEKEELHKSIDFEVEEKKPEHEDECNTYENEFILNESATQERQSASEQVQGVEIQYVGIVNENAEEETEDKSKLSSVVNEEETPIMVKQEDILLPKETDDKSMKADAICEVGGEEQLSLTLIQDEEYAESRAVEKVREATEATKEPREIAIADDPSIEEGHASVEEAEQLSVEVKDANAEVVLEDHALIEKVNQTGDGDKEIADRKAAELNSKEDFKVSKEEVEKPETVVTEIRSVTIEREVKVESEVKGSALEKDSIVEENTEEENKNKSKLSAVNEEVLQPKETEDKSIDAIVIMEDEVKEQGHQSIQQAEGLTISVEDAKPEESKDDEENETVQDKTTTCKDVLDAEESTEVVLAEYASMEKENDVNQIGDGDTEPTAALDVSGGDQGGFLEDIQKEELSSSPELQKSNGYTEQTEVNSSVEIAEPSVSTDAAVVSTPLVPLQLVESSSSVVVSESETREAVEEALESNSYLNEAKETPTIGDAADETTPACEVPESGVEEKECLEEASIIQVDENEEVHSGNQEKEIETMEVVSSEIKDTDGKDQIVEPEKEPSTIVSEKDYICDDIPNEEVNDEQGSVDTSGEVKEQVLEEVVHVKEIHEERASIPEIEKLELSSTAVLKEVCLEKEELQKPIDFEVEENKSEDEDADLASHVQECNTYENELILNENATQERQSASEQAQGGEIQYVCIVNENAEEETEDKSKLSVVNEEETPMVRQDDILQTKEMDDKSMNAADVICEDGGEEQLSLALIQDEEHTESQAVEMEAEVASFELLEKVREDTEAIKEPREIAIIEEGHSSIQEAEQLSVEVNDANAEKDSIVEENTEEENKNKSKLSAVNEEVLQPKETEDKSIDAIVIMEDEVKEQGHPSIQHPEENETVEDKETTCRDVLEAEESTEVALAEYALMEKENDVNQIGDGDKEVTAYVVVAESETREAVEEALESNSYLNEAKETPTIGDAADETTPGYEVPESGVEAKECLEEASIIQVDENEEIHSGNQEKEIETMEVVSSEIEAPEIHMKSEDTEGKDIIVEPEKESATIVSEKDYICDDILNEEVNDEQGSAEGIIESTSIAESIIEKDVIVESEETEKETEENNTMEIERSKMQMQDSSSIPPQTEEVIMEENASYNKIGNEESVEVLREQTTTEEPPLSESVQESEAVSKETLILDTQHEFEELEKQPKSTDDSVYDLNSNEGVNDEQQASVETTEEIKDQVVEKQNMSDEIELGDAEEIQQTPDEHVAERSCEIEMQVIKEDISIEDGKDGERDIDESDSKLEDGAEKSVNEVNKGSDSELVPDQYIEATDESESSAVKQLETVEKTEVENELIKIESSNIEEISVADVKEETPIEEEADSEEQGERDSGSWEDTSENESSTGKLEEKIVTEVEEISCSAEKVELANEAQPDTESKETEVSSHVTFETIKEETETKESISEAEDYENGDLKIQDDAEKQHESVSEKIEPLQDGISHAEADNGYEAVESETNEVSFVIEASEQEISSVEEKGTVSGDYIETEDITECIREGDDETQEPATKSESSTAELHKEEDMSSILQDKAAEEHAKEETAEEIESPGFASSVTLETEALTSEVNHEFVDSEAKNLNFEEIKKLDVTEEKKDTVSGECKEAGDTSTCVTEGVDENEIKEDEIDSTVTIESTEITSEETEAKKEEADSEPENCRLVEAEGPVSGEYKEAEEDSRETAGEVAEASEATEGVKFTEEEEKGENEATKQFIGKDVDAAKENYETVTEVRKVLTPTVHSEDMESSKEVAEEEDTSYVKSVAVDEVEAKLSDVVTENGSELHPPREEAGGEGGLQDCASKEAVISDGGTQIVFDDGKITPEVKAEAFTTGVVEKNIDTSYVVIDAEVRDSKSQIIDGKGFDETSLDAATDKAADLSLSDLLHEARDQNLEVPMPLTEEKDMVGSTSELHNEETDAHEAKTDEEAEEVMVESCKEIDVKTPKKHSNILSGVSSKVKHSISKVKKAITGKSSNSKTKVSKTNEALPDS